MEMTRQEAVDMSILKWTAYAEGKSPDNRSCGFCLYCSDSPCSGCVLYPDICGTTDSLYEQWGAADDFSIEDIKLAQQILDAIKTRGQAWIEEEQHD